MKFNTDFQIEFVVSEDLTPEEIEEGLSKYDSVENYAERMKQIMTMKMKNLAGVDLDKLDVKVKVFVLEK